MSTRTHIGFFSALIACLFIPQLAFCQTEKLGIVTVNPPAGWTKTAKENIVTYSEINESTGRFCTITLYGATPGTGDPKTDFAREWKNLVASPFKAGSDPATETDSAEGWTVVAGGSPVDFGGGKALAFLTVFSRARTTVSVLGIFNDESYLAKLVAFGSSLKFETAKETAAVAPPQVQNGRLVIPPISRQLTIADLVGEWGENAGITTTYVDRYTGTYAGFESLHFTSKMTITPAGGFLNDFFALQNGRKIIENTSGSVSISGRVLTIKHKNTAKYVIRGWLELPDITILEICGPWYDNDPIPAEIFTNPDQGWNLDKKWVRKK